MTDQAPPRRADSAEGLVVGALHGLVCEWYGPDARLQPDPPFQIRTWSVHVRPVVELPDRQVPLVVKIPTWAESPTLEEALAAGPQESTQREFAALGEIRSMVEAADDPGLRAVEPVAYIPELNAVVTELFDGVPLRSMLRPGGWSGAVTALAGVGRWLKRYHTAVGRASARPFPVEAIEAEIHALAESVEALRCGPAMTLGLRRLSGLVTGLAGTTVAMAVTHGDLGPSNVLVDEAGRIAVIDPNDAFAPAVADPAKLITAMRTATPRLLWGVPGGCGQAAAERALLEGYDTYDSRALMVLRSISCIRRWLDVERAAAGVRRVSLVQARRVLRAELECALSGAES